MAGQHLPPVARLERLGLSPAEARAYDVLVRRGALGAPAVATAIQATRSTAYGALRGLMEKGLVESSLGHGTPFRPVAPEQALVALVDRDREALAQELAGRETLAKELAVEMAEGAGGAEVSAGDLVEILRDRRTQVDRLTRLEMAAEREVNFFMKAPMVGTGGNPMLVSMLHRGVRVRALYEADIFNDDEVAAHFDSWVEHGEEARLFPGALPFKLVLVDGHTALMPLETPAADQAVTAVLLRHPAFGTGLRMLFDRLWEQSRPLKKLPSALTTPVQPGEAEDCVRD